MNTQGRGQISGACEPLLHIVTPSTRLVLCQAAQMKSLQVSEVHGPPNHPSTVTLGTCLTRRLYPVLSAWVWPLLAVLAVKSENRNAF